MEENPAQSSDDLDELERRKLGLEIRRVEYKNDKLKRDNERYDDHREEVKKRSQADSRAVFVTKPFG